jgi:hypothetical protein
MLPLVSLIGFVNHPAGFITAVMEAATRYAHFPKLVESLPSLSLENSLSCVSWIVRSLYLHDESHFTLVRAQLFLLHVISSKPNEYRIQVRDNTTPSATAFCAHSQLQ